MPPLIRHIVYNFLEGRQILAVIIESQDEECRVNADDKVIEYEEEIDGTSDAGGNGKVKIMHCYGSMHQQ